MATAEGERPNDYRWTDAPAADGLPGLIDRIQVLRRDGEPDAPVEGMVLTFRDREKCIKCVVGILGHPRALSPVWLEGGQTFMDRGQAREWVWDHVETWLGRDARLIEPDSEKEESE